jgi:predicted RNA binding protein YcfA (HicA-like mRNA interferase family)
MGKKQKLFERLYSNPKDFRWSELTTLLNYIGYKQIQGKGARVKFYRESPRSLISIHRPHPGEILKTYQVKDIIQKLEEDRDGND